MAPKILPPREMRVPRLVHMKAIPVARTPKKTDRILVAMASLAAVMPLKQESCGKVKGFVGARSKGLFLK